MDRTRRGDLARGQLQVKELIPTNLSPGWLLELKPTLSSLEGQLNRKQGFAAYETAPQGAAAWGSGWGGGREETPRRASPRTGQWRVPVGEIQTSHIRKKRCVASPETKEMHTQATMEYYFSPIRWPKIKTKWYLVLKCWFLVWVNGHTGALVEGGSLAGNWLSQVDTIPPLEMA